MPTLVESFKAQTLLPHTSHHWKGITDSVCYFLAKDMMPYDTVNAAGFRHMLREIEPRYVPPDRKSVATNYMPKLYEREKARVQQQIEGINRFAITTDIWTSRAHHSCIGTTVTRYITLWRRPVLLQSFGSAAGLCSWHFLGFTQTPPFPTGYNMSYIPLDRDISHTHSAVISQP